MSPAAPNPPASPPGTLGLLVSTRGPAAYGLTLPAPQLLRAGLLSQLELDVTVPGTRAPTVEELLRRRGRVRRALLSIDEAALSSMLRRELPRLLAQRPEGTPSFDLIETRFGLSGGQPTLFCLFRSGPSGSDGPVWGSVRLRPIVGTGPLAGPLLLGVSEVRLYSSSTTAAPLYGYGLAYIVAAALLQRPRKIALPPALQGGPPPFGLRILSTLGLSELRVDLLHDALISVMPPLGCRVPEPATAPLVEVRLEGTTLHFRYSGEGTRGANTWSDLDERSERPRSAPQLSTNAEHNGAPLPEPIRIGDVLLLSTDKSAAIAAYRIAELGAQSARLARARRALVLAAEPSRRAESISLATDEQGENGPSWPYACLAGIESERGQHSAAARNYLTLAALSDNHPVEKICALLAAARELSRSSPDSARQKLSEAEQALAELGGEPSALRDVLVHLSVSLPAPSSGDHVSRVAAPMGPVGPSPVELSALRAACSGAEGEARLEALERALAQVPGDPVLLLLRCELEEPVPALLRIEAALSDSSRTIAEDDLGELRPLLLFAARTAADLGEIERARAFLRQVGSHEESLRARVQLDWPELLQAEPGSAADLLPVLRELHNRGWARADELRGLARLYTVRGDHAEALAVQNEAGGDPDVLLAALESAGRHEELLAALEVHAELRPEQAALLYQQAASVAEQQLSDAARAAAYWQRAAGSKALSASEAAGLWLHAGRLFYELLDSDRAHAAFAKALALDPTQGKAARLLLAHLQYESGAFAEAEQGYRAAIEAGVVSPSERAQVYLRLAELAHDRGEPRSEEEYLAAAIEAGGGALAWPALCALYRQIGERARLGVALCAWAEYEQDELKISLLREAAQLVGPDLLPRVDQELIKLDADDEAVRDRVLARLSESGERNELMHALRRDVERSTGTRRRQLARRLARLALQLADYPTAVSAWLSVLSTEASELGDAEPLLSDSGLREALLFWSALDRAGRIGPFLDSPGLLAHIEELRGRLIEKGQLTGRLAQIDRQLALLTEKEREQPARATLLRRAAEIQYVLGDAETSARRYVQLLAVARTDSLVLSRCRMLLRRLAQSGHAEKALRLVDGEQKRLGRAAPLAYGLRLAQAELLQFIGRSSEALGQLELLLMRSPRLGPAHALLGMYLGTSSDRREVERGLEHLLIAAYSLDVDAREAGECALCAAEILSAMYGTHRVDTATLISETTVSAAAPGYVDRMSSGTWVAVPADFLDVAYDDDGRAVPSEAPPSPSSRTYREVALGAEPPPLPTALSVRELLEVATALLPADPRPLEGLLGLLWSMGELGQALELCDRLLAMAREPRERARLLVEKAVVYRRKGETEPAFALLEQALALVAEFQPALEELRRLCTTEGRNERAWSLAQRELLGLPGEAIAARAALLYEIGKLERTLGKLPEAQATLRRAGLLGHLDAWLLLTELLSESSDWLGAADAAGRAALLGPESERAERLTDAAELALRADDELRARDYLQQAVALGGPSGLLAEERLLDLDGGREPLRRLRTLERRLSEGHIGEGVALLEALRRLVLLCAELDDPAGMLRHAEALRARRANEPVALFALAEDAASRGLLERAGELLSQAGPIPPEHPRALQLLQIQGEASVLRGDLSTGESAYRELLHLSEERGDGEHLESASEGLIRLCEQRGDLLAAMRLLKRRLPFLPVGAVSQRATLRLRLFELARAMRETDEAQQQLEAILEESPTHRGALAKLTALHRECGQLAEARRLTERLLELSMTPAERAEWLTLLAELAEESREELGEVARLYERVIEAWPAHTKALRRLITLGLRMGDGVRVADAYAGLRRAGLRTGEVSAQAGLGLLLIPGTRSPESVSLLSHVGPAELAAALSLIGTPPGTPPGDLSYLDGPIAGALFSLNGERDELAMTLRARLSGAPSRFDEGVYRVLARLFELSGPNSGASDAAQRLYVSVLAFVYPRSATAARCSELGGLPVSDTDLEQAMPAVAADQAPWLKVFSLLGRYLLGLPPSPGLVSHEWTRNLEELGARLGLSELEVTLVDALPQEGLSSANEPARCEASRPPRVRLLRRLTADPAQASYAALRSLHLLCAGGTLLSRNSHEDAAALVRAAATLWLPGPEPLRSSAQTPREQRFLGLLQSLALAPGHAQGISHEASAAAAELKTCVEELEQRPQLLKTLGPALLSTMERHAEARALGQLGDLRAALSALCPLSLLEGGPEERLKALLRTPLAELLSVAALLYDG